MNKYIIVLVLIIIASAAYWWFYGQQEEENGTAELANPAAVYCLEQGGELTNITLRLGARGFCNFDDGSFCGQWDFYRGDCDKGDLKKEILKEGTGEMADNGDVLSMHYVGTLEDGTKFDSSRDRGTPFSFTLGMGQVIQGWEQGVLGMKVGEKSKLTISPDLGYGVNGIPGVIPPNTTLIFEVELLEIK